MTDVKLESPLLFLQNFQKRSPNEHFGTLVKTLRCQNRQTKNNSIFSHPEKSQHRLSSRRLQSLLATLQLADMANYGPLNVVADFATLLGTYSKGFIVITEPRQIDGDRNEVLLQFWYSNTKKKKKKKTELTDLTCC